MVKNNYFDFGLTKDYKTYILGYSAGGYTGAMLSLREKEYGTDSITTFIGIATPLDLQYIYEIEKNIPIEFFLEQFLGRTNYITASPYEYIKSDEDTKFIVFVGKEDLFVSAIQAHRFIERLNVLNGNGEFHEIPKENHFSIFNQITIGEVNRVILENIL